MKTISGLDYEWARDNYMGWCSACEDWTREQTEPDAEEYICPDCGNKTVIGAEDAMLMEKFYISDSDDED
jgi:Zn finger protein HypA/HybF involved in hydrogenase expression